jgi:hypothetical protein
MNSHDTTLDHRARLERAQLEAAERRVQSIADQRSPLNSHDQRVRAWERLHQVNLPKDPAHRVLRVVARQTGMALAEVQEVQRQRVQPPAT